MMKEWKQEKKRNEGEKERMKKWIGVGRKKSMNEERERNNRMKKERKKKENGAKE